MTVLSVAQDVCFAVGLAKPSALVSATDREYLELLSVMKEMALRISRGYDWQKLARIATITGDGSTESFDFPSDYDRMPIKARLWSSSLEASLTHIPDIDQWLGLDVQSFSFVVNSWTIYGDQIHIKPALGNAVTVKYFYQSNLLWVSGGSNVADIAADSDTFRIDEQLLKHAVIWRLKELKGQAYAENMADYEELKERLVARDKGPGRIRVGAIRKPMGANTAYPTNIVVD